MKTRILPLLVSLAFFHSMAIAQQKTSDCNERPGSTTKVFVFVGELLSLRKIPGEKDINQKRFLATYKIIERICGRYEGDTILFNIIQSDYDTSFTRIKNQLLMLTKDTTQSNDYVLSEGYDVFKTKKNRWAVPFRERFYIVSFGQKELKPRKMGFTRDSFYDMKGFTKEEVGIAFYEPYYRVEGDRVYPLIGCTVEEVFEYEKGESLETAGAYGSPADPDLPDITEVEMVEYKEDPDSVKQVLEKEFLEIKELLSKDPFDEKQIWALINNCRRKKDFSYCKAYFVNLLRDYPDNICSYIVKAKLRHRETSLEDTSRIPVWRQALKLDSNNYEVNYELALSYYNLFHEQPGRHYAEQARKLFMRCAAIDTTELVLLRYPVIQLSHYLDDPGIADRYQAGSFRVDTDAAGVAVERKYNWYFPIELLLRKKKNWMTDYSVDIMHQLHIATYLARSTSDAFVWLREPVLSTQPEKNVYRLAWFRSFDGPVVIRLEQTKGEVMIYWKMADLRDAEGYNHPAPEFSKRLSLGHWKKFEDLLGTIDYWTMFPADYSHKSTDGSAWVLEGAVDGKYQFTERPGDVYPKYVECLKYLLYLTDLRIPKKRIY